MTSEEIKQKANTDLSTNGWLREIAIQLALLNEKNEQPKVEASPEAPAERMKRAYTKRK